jgi:von Willebrand factor type A domain
MTQQVSPFGLLTCCSSVVCGFSIVSLSFCSASGGLLCSNNAADVVFVVDASQSNSFNDWQSGLAFMTSIVNNFTVSAQATRFAMVRYSDVASVQFSFTEHSSASGVVGAINSASQGSSSTRNLAGALKLSLSDLFLQQGRASATKVTVAPLDQNPLT